MDDGHALDAFLYVVAGLGQRRCDGLDNNNTSAIVPHERDQVWCDKIKQQWRNHSPQNMENYHVELLRRAEQLINFISANVGKTDDFPIQLVAETEETDGELQSCIESLRVSVNFLTEI